MILFICNHAPPKWEEESRDRDICPAGGVVVMMEAEPGHLRELRRQKICPVIIIIGSTHEQALTTTWRRGSAQVGIHHFRLLK
jgi:hypothetical protein